MGKIITVESVTDGHPDKVCDQISDAILDAFLKQDPLSRTGIECLGSHGLLVIGGEVKTTGVVDYKALASKVYKEIGYNDELKIITNVIKQSPDIGQGVDIGGAGDQGIMYGYATNETESLMPPSVEAVHKLTRGLRDVRRNDPEFSFLGPDGKAQLTYENGNLKIILISTQHDADVSQEIIREKITNTFIPNILGDVGNAEILINPTGLFTIGGFAADAGLTGRKIMVDTYCGLVPHGGGAFSGKDASKVDRSAAYYCRYVAKHIIAKKLAEKVLVSVAYAIGKVEPLMVEVDTYGTGDDKTILDYVNKDFDFRPQNIIEELDLRKPVFRDTASFGHFGHDDYAWEKVK
jgi:S-adenosylmethionine synthetase